jgi:hypothetical protein
MPSRARSRIRSDSITWPACTIAHEAHPCTTSGLSSPTQTAITRAGVLRRSFLPLGDAFTSTRPDEVMFTVGDVVPGPSIGLVLVRPAVAVLVLQLPVADVEPPRVRPHAFGISCDRPPTGSTGEAAVAWCLVNRRNTARPGLPGQDDHCSLTRGASLGHRPVPGKCHAKPRPQDFSGAAAKPPTPSCFRANASVLVFGLLCIGWAELPEIFDLLL